MYMGEYPLRRKAGSKQQMKVNQYKQIEYLTFPLLDEVEWVRHLFSTRIGGVSEGIFRSMNLSYSRGDDKEAVDENFRRMAEIFGALPERIVCSKQTHTTHVKRVDERDLGKGVVRPADYEDVDGLITDTPGIILSTSYADCVPLYFVDTEHRAIGLSHSGWRGTAARMGQATLNAMAEAFGTRPEKVLAAIGPSICADCYEISEEVAAVFQRNFQDSFQTFLLPGKAEGKYQLDLWKANQRVLLDAGVFEEHIAVTDLCTCCNSEYLYSHRASNGKRGALAAMMELRKS